MWTAMLLQTLLWISNSDDLGLPCANIDIICCLYFMASLSWNHNYSFFFFFSDSTTIFFTELYSSKIVTAAMKAIQTWPKLSANAFAIWVAHSQGFKFQKNVSLPSLLHRLKKWVSDCKHAGFWISKMWFWLCNMREHKWSRGKNHR